jgi:hypothetical protein
LQVAAKVVTGDVPGAYDADPDRRAEAHASWSTVAVTEAILYTAGREDSRHRKHAYR